VGFSVYKNNGATEFENVHAHHDFTGGGGDTNSITMSGNITLAVNDTVELWVWNETSTSNVVIDDVTMHLETSQGGATGPQGPQGPAGADGTSGGGGIITVKNTSGGTVAANDVGYINEDMEYKETTTANLDGVAWCVVTTGGANNADISVAVRGRVTVALNANSSIGDFIVTSTTAGQAGVSSTMRPEIFGRCITANGAGAGGTCDVLLLTGTRYVTASDANAPYIVNSASNWLFTATINGAPTATSVVYTVVTGNENSIVPASSTQLGKAHLHNTTRGTSRLITAVNTGTNTITTVSSTDSWANGDALTIESQTCVSGGTSKYRDIDFSQTTVVPELARMIALDAGRFDSTALAGVEFTGHHPYETFSTVKQQLQYATVTSIWYYRSMLVPLFDRKYCVTTRTGGAGTAWTNDVLIGYTLAIP
jgi:hypothetical protein